MGGTTGAKKRSIEGDDGDTEAISRRKKRLEF